MKLRKPFSRVGGKTYNGKKILNFFPTNYQEYNYVEPFCGGASLYFYKEKANEDKFEVLNDIDNNVKILLDGFKTFSKEEITEELEKLPLDIDTFNHLKRVDTSTLTEFQKIIRLLYLSKNSYAGMMRSFNPKITKLQRIKMIENGGQLFRKYKLDDFRNRMDRTIISNEDYKEIIRKYDSENTLFYIDPPYENSSRMYKHFNVDYNELAEILKNIKGKFLLSINKNPLFLDIFNYNHTIIKVKYQNIGTMNKNGKQREIEEFLFYNF